MAEHFRQALFIQNKAWGLFSANDLLPFGVIVLFGERDLVAEKTSGLSGTVFEGQQHQALS